MSDHPENTIRNAYDRIQEAHWNIHQMELHFHESDSFRYSLNSYLRVLKEVPQILQMELQNKSGFVNWFNERKQETLKDPLISDLFKKRDIVVHRSMLKPKSSAVLGVARWKKMKAGFGMRLNPFEDSDVLLVKYLQIIHSQGEDVFGITIEDEDTLPCIERSWGLDPFDDDILKLVSNAWEKVASLLSDTIVWLGGSQVNPKLECVHDSSNVKYRYYNREWIADSLEAIKQGMDFDKVLDLLREKRYKR